MANEELADKIMLAAKVCFIGYVSPCIIFALVIFFWNKGFYEVKIVSTHDLMVLV